MSGVFELLSLLRLAKNPMQPSPNCELIYLAHCSSHASVPSCLPGGVTSFGKHCSKTDWKMDLETNEEAFSKGWPMSSSRNYILLSPLLFHSFSRINAWVINFSDLLCKCNKLDRSRGFVSSWLQASDNKIEMGIAWPFIPSLWYLCFVFVFPPCSCIYLLLLGSSFTWNCLDKIAKQGHMLHLPPPVCKFLPLQVLYVLRN